MNLKRKNFIPLNEGFVCESCNTVVPPAKGTFRNHCTACLAAKHVDDTTPGDRSSTCGGVMPAIGVTGPNPDNLVITHKCQICGKINRNKLASDDDIDAAIALFDPKP